MFFHSKRRSVPKRSHHSHDLQSFGVAQRPGSPQSQGPAGYPNCSHLFWISYTIWLVKSPIVAMSCHFQGWFKLYPHYVPIIVGLIPDWKPRSGEFRYVNWRYCTCKANLEVYSLTSPLYRLYICLLAVSCGIPDYIPFKPRYLSDMKSPTSILILIPWYSLDCWFDPWFQHGFSNVFPTFFPGFCWVHPPFHLHQERMNQLFEAAANSRLRAGGLVGHSPQLGGMKAAAAWLGSVVGWKAKMGGWSRNGIHGISGECQPWMKKPRLRLFNWEGTP